MDDVRGDFLGSPHGTPPAAVIADKIIVRFLFFFSVYKNHYTIQKDRIKLKCDVTVYHG